jgi:copper chaperone
MRCQHCVGAVSKALQEIKGVSQVKVDLAKGEASFEGDVELAAVKAAIARTGFEVVG